MRHEDEETEGERERAWARYKGSGVDTRQSDAYASQFLDIVQETWAGSLVEVEATRAFAGVFSAPGAAEGTFLAGSTDGVGTKARWLGRQGLWEVIGWDCVAMNVNDVVVTGARPLVFMNYLGVSAFGQVPLERIVRGMAQATRQARCAMVGGETAAMRGVYREGECDVVGFCLGQGSRRWRPKEAVAGDWLVGFASWGMHANGYTLVNEAQEAFGAQMVRALNRPTRMYGEELWGLDAREGVEVVGAIHVTGGGLLGRLEGLEREAGCRVKLKPGALPCPGWMEEMCRREGLGWEGGAAIWNAGVGLVAVVRGDVEGQEDLGGGGGDWEA